MSTPASSVSRSDARQVRASRSVSDADLGQEAEVRRLQHVEAVPPHREDEIVPGRAERTPPARADPVEHGGEVERGRPVASLALDELELVVRAVSEERGCRRSSGCEYFVW